MSRRHTFGRRRWLPLLTLGLAWPAPLAVGADEAVQGLLKQAVEGGLRAILKFEAAPQVIPGFDVNGQQRAQQVQQFEQMLQPVANAELEFIRGVCGDLAPAARREIKRAAADAVRKAAEQVAAQQHRPGRRGLDLAELFAERLDPVVEKRLPPATRVTYRRERDARRARQAETARLLIVAKLDEELDLSAAQRDAILRDLASLWDDAWLCELQDSGVVINAHRPAPDYARECIEPHLDHRQRDLWAGWVQVAGWRQAGLNQGWRFPDGPGLQGTDPWWDR